MPGKALNTLEVRNSEEWLKWLEKHHDTEAEVWLIFYKKHTGRNPSSTARRWMRRCATGGRQSCQAAR